LTTDRAVERRVRERLDNPRVVDGPYWFTRREVEALLRLLDTARAARARRQPRKEG